MNNAQNIAIYDNSDDLATAAATKIAAIARNAITRRGRWTIALVGGSTPEATYKRLAQTEWTSEVDWSQAHVFVSDERFVTPADPRSNFGMAQRTLLAHINTPAAQIHAVDTSLPTPADAARAYDLALRSHFPDTDTDPTGVPQFDLVLLGLGDDGHTASLFPHAAALSVRDALVTSSPPGTLPPPVDRITFTFPLINAARNIVFLVAGDKKAPALRDVLKGGASADDRPAAGVMASGGGAVWWFLDRGAGAGL